MPLPQLALLGPWIAYQRAGKIGAQIAASVGFASFLLFAHASPFAVGAAALLALAAAWGVPAFMEKENTEDRRVDDAGASAIVVDCDGFTSLDDSYGPGTSDHVFAMLHRALREETRDTDLVVNAKGQELIIVLDGSTPTVAQAVMARVERRFSIWLADAGYECNLSVGLSGIDEEQVAFENLMRASRRSNGGPYMD